MDQVKDLSKGDDHVMVLSDLGQQDHGDSNLEQTSNKDGNIYDENSRCEKDNQGWTPVKTRSKTATKD
ncbi:hypothetical protein RIF29_25404 [Crotalaria pallida]|uniref:Uncharacterized protein n=1 Tax=Crotalaria pallida TaxID=3830 RepID=A0AAN9EMD4_CROPI